MKIHLYKKYYIDLKRIMTAENICLIKILNRIFLQKELEWANLQFVFLMYKSLLRILRTYIAYLINLKVKKDKENLVLNSIHLSILDLTKREKFIVRNERKYKYNIKQT